VRNSSTQPSGVFTLRVTLCPEGSRQARKNSAFAGFDSQFGKAPEPPEPLALPPEALPPLGTAPPVALPPLPNSPPAAEPPGEVPPVRTPPDEAPPVPDAGSAGPQFATSGAAASIARRK
jgi:hypothetical protein